MGINAAAAVALMAAAVAIAVMAVAGAQTIPSCASKLVPCAYYLNATTAPPQTCCGPLKTAAQDELPCLCALYNDTAVLQSFHVNITQALNLAKLCGASTDTSSCANITQSGGSSSTTPSSSTNTPATPAGKGTNSAPRATWIGLPGLVSLLLCSWSLVA